MKDNEDFPSVRELLNISRIRAEILKQTTFGSADTDMIVDIAVKAADDVTAAFTRTITLLPLGSMRLQAAPIAIQMAIAALQLQLDEILSVAVEMGGELRVQQPDGSYVTRKNDQRTKPN